MEIKEEELKKLVNEQEVVDAEEIKAPTQEELANFKNKLLSKVSKKEMRRFLKKKKLSFTDKLYELIRQKNLKNINESSK